MFVLTDERDVATVRAALAAYVANMAAKSGNLEAFGVAAEVIAEFDARGRAANELLTRLTATPEKPAEFPKAA